MCSTAALAAMRDNRTHAVTAAFTNDEASHPCGRRRAWLLLLVGYRPERQSMAGSSAGERRAKRVLIDWDFAARGIWKILSTEVGRGDPRPGPELDGFWARTAELVERTQQELGPIRGPAPNTRRRSAMGSASVTARATAVLGGGRTSRRSACSSPGVPEARRFEGEVRSLLVRASGLSCRPSLWNRWGEPSPVW